MEVGEGLPCLVMHGGLGGEAKIMHEGIPNSELIVFENSGHFTHVEEPEAFFDAVRGWLRRS